VVEGAAEDLEVEVAGKGRVLKQLPLGPGDLVQASRVARVEPWGVHLTKRIVKKARRAHPKAAVRLPLVCCLRCSMAT